MSISQVSSTSSVEVVESGSNSSMDKEAFLTLLCTQLQYQDPTNPVDSTQMAEQQVMFAELEQLMNLNSTIEDFTESQTEMMNAMAGMFNTMESTGYIGKNVSYFTDEITVSEDGTVDSLYYDLSQDALVGYKVKDENGLTVKTVDQTLTETGNKLSIGWDGTDNNGDAVEAGTYTIEIDAQTTTGDDLEGQAYTDKLVSSVVFNSGTPIFVLADGTRVDATEILAVSST